MRKFLLRLFIVFLFTWVLLEGVLRWFDLARFTIPTEQIGNNCMLKPKYAGTYVGGGFGEIQSEFIINHQGWNSTVDYQILQDTQKIRVALIGDSYVEGLHVDVDNSIGRQLDKLTRNRTITHEFGRSGANIEDFKLIYTTQIKGKYDYVFVFLRDGNFNADAPTFMNCNCPENKNKINGSIRSIYSNSAVLSYLNINQLLSENLLGMVNGIRSKFSLKDEEQSSASKQVLPILTVKKQVDWIFGPEVIVIYESKLLDIHSKSVEYPIKQNTFLKINHNEGNRLDFAFDKHWNIQGRKDCAATMFRAIRL